MLASRIYRYIVTSSMWSGVVTTSISPRRCFLAMGVVTTVLPLLPTVALAATEHAESADAFVDSIGVNTHYGNAAHGAGNAYANPLLDAKLAELGIRHLRDHTWNDAGLKRIDSLHTKYGIRTNLVVGETTRSPAELVNILKKHPAYEAIEGLNEPDFTTHSYNGLTDDAANKQYSATKAFQTDLYSAIKADPQTSRLLVFSPAMGRSFRSKYLVPIPFDVAAMHSYAWATKGITSHPPSAGLDTSISNMATLRGSKPLWATETGYFNRSSTDARRVPESVSAKYIPRLFGEFFNRSIPRTYLYELTDQGASSTAREENFGLVRFDMTEKPAFVALENLIDLLEEPGVGKFSPGSLNYALTMNGPGDLNKIHHSLLQKSKGTFYLLLWQEMGGFNRSTQTVISNPALAVRLTLNTPIRQAKIYVTNHSLKPMSAHLHPKIINLNVPDEMLVVELSATGP